MKITGKQWTGFIALTLVGSMIAAYIPLRDSTKVTLNRRDSSDETAAAANYLHDNTDTIRQGEMDRIWKAIKNAVFEEPRTYRYYYTLASLKIGNEKFDEALTAISKCLELYKGSDAEVLTDLWLKKGCLCAMLNRRPEAISSLDKALLINPTLNQVYLVKSQVHVQAGELAEALRNLKAYFKEVPDADEYRFSLAQLMAAQKDLAGAATELSLLAERGLANEGVYALRAACYLQEGEYQKAVEDYGRCIALSPDKQEYRYYRGVCLMFLEDYTAAAEDFANCLKAGKDDAPYLEALARYQAGQYEKALPLMKALSEKGAEDTVFYYAVCAMKTDDLNLAVESFTKAIDMKQKAQAAYYNRALCRVKLGDAQNAIADFKQAAAMNEDPQIKAQAQSVIDQTEKAIKDHEIPNQTKAPQNRVVKVTPTAQATQSPTAEPTTTSPRP